MAGPTPSEQATMSLLNSINDQLKQMNSMASKSRSNQEIYKDKRAYNNTVKGLDKLEKNSARLAKTLAKTEREFEKSAMVFGKSLKDVIRDFILPGAKTTQNILKDWANAQEDIEKNQVAQYKKIAAGTRDYLKNNKGATASIKDATEAYRQYISVIKNISKNQNKVSKEDEETVKRLSAIVSKLYSEGNINVLNNLTTDQRKSIQKLAKGIELTNAQFRMLAQASSKIGDNFTAISEATDQYYTGLTRAKRGLNEAMTEAFKSLANNIKLAVIAAAPQIFKDLMAQAKNAVGTSNYGQSLRLGVSQADLSEFIGQNRLALRAIGDGSSTAAVNNGQINQLQNQAHNYGLTGNDALKFIGGTFDSLVKMGLTPTVENATKQMQKMYETMQITGMTFEQLNSLVSDLSTSPAFVQLAQSNNFSGQTDQIAILSKMLRTEGYSADYLKQLLELNKQANYQGIEQAVKGMVGVQLLSGQINRTLGTNAISKEDIGLLQELKARGPGALQTRYAAGAYNGYTIGGKKVEDMFGTGTKGATKFSSYALNRQLEINKLQQQAYTGASSSDDLFGGLVNKTLLGNFSGLAGPEYQQTDAALLAQANLKGTTGSINPTQDAINKMMGASDQLVKSINDIDNAFIPFGQTLNKFVADMQEGLSGFKSNPAGQASAGLAGAISDIVKNVLIYKGITKLGGALGAGGLIGRLGTLATGAKGLLSGGAAAGMGALRGLGSFAAGAGGLARTGAGFLGRGALGLASSSAGMVAGAGAGGYLLGTGINKLPELFGGNDLSTLIVDWLMKDKDAAISTMLHGDAIMGNTKAANILDKDKSKNPFADDPITNDGATAGDLFERMVITLDSIDSNQKKLLESTQDIHKENMEVITKRDNNQMIQAARNNVRGVLSGGV